MGKRQKRVEPQTEEEKERALWVEALTKGEADLKLKEDTLRILKVNGAIQEKLIAFIKEKLK